MFLPTFRERAEYLGLGDRPTHPSPQQLMRLTKKRQGKGGVTRGYGGGGEIMLQVTKHVNKTSDTALLSPTVKCYTDRNQLR